MAGSISLYTDSEAALREEGAVIYSEGPFASTSDIYEFGNQLHEFSSSFGAAYLEYLKLSSLGVNNIFFTYLPIRNSSIGFSGGPVRLNLKHILHGYGFPTFSSTDGSRDLLYDMADTIRRYTPILSESDSSKVQYYDNLVKRVNRRIDVLDATNTSSKGIADSANFFYQLDSRDVYGNNILDGLIECEDFNVRLQTLSLINKLLFYSYKERKVDSGLSKISRPEDIQRDMAYEVFSLRKTDLGLYKSIFSDTSNQELIDYVSSHAYLHYSGTRDIGDLIKNGRREYLRVASLKVLDKYQEGTLDVDKLGIDIPNKINNTMSKYYKNVSKSLKNNPLDVDELNETIFKEDISIYDLMKFKYYFENYKNDADYNSIRELFIDRFNLDEDFSIDDVISSHFIKLSKDLSLGKGDSMDVSTCGGLIFGISSEIINKVNSAHIGIGFNSPNNYSDILDYINLTEEDFENYKHEIVEVVPSIDYVRSKYLKGTDDTINRLIAVKRMLTSSIVKQVILNKYNINDAIAELETYGCGNYLDIINAIIDTPECMDRLATRFINGDVVFNMSRISQKCDSLKGLGNIIDNESGVKIMTAVEDLYYRDTGNSVSPTVSSTSRDTIENFIVFVPGDVPNVGTSVYLELKDVGGFGNYQLVPSHVYLNQRLEYHNYGGKSKVGITVHVNHSDEHLPLDDVNARFVGSSSSPQDVQLQEMLRPNFNFGTGTTHTSGLGGGH